MVYPHDRLDKMITAISGMVQCRGVCFSLGGGMRFDLIQFYNQYNSVDGANVLTIYGLNQISPLLGLANRSCLSSSQLSILSILTDFFSGRGAFPIGVRYLEGLKLLVLLPSGLLSCLPSYAVCPRNSLWCVLEHGDPNHTITSASPSNALRISPSRSPGEMVINLQIWKCLLVEEPPGSLERFLISHKVISVW